MTAPVPILEARGLVRDFPLPRPHPFAARRFHRALDGVSLTVTRGRSLGLIGESGSGKTTFARIAVALDRPDAGAVRIAGEDLTAATGARLTALRRRMQMVFQDPYGSLDPRHRVARIVAEPLFLLDAEAPDARRARLEAALAAVGLGAEALDRYPHEFSGGQRQRIAIARALVTAPDLVVADEPVSALDVSVQAQVLNLFADLAETKGVTFLFISHDLSVVRHVTADVAVLHQGRLVERGPTAEVLARPAHPYAQALVAAVPRPDPRRRRKPDGIVVDLPAAAPTGCAYRLRCPRAAAICADAVPPLAEIAPGRAAACHFPG